METHFACFTILDFVIILHFLEISVLTMGYMPIAERVFLSRTTKLIVILKGVVGAVASLYWYYVLYDNEMILLCIETDF